jgi:hypothetical protein
VDLREQLDVQLRWGNEAQSELRATREDARLYNIARKEALAERDAAWEHIKVLETEIRAWMRIATRGNETERKLRIRAEQAESALRSMATNLRAVPDYWIGEPPSIETLIAEHSPMMDADAETSPKSP